MVSFRFILNLSVFPRLRPSILRQVSSRRTNVTIVWGSTLWKLLLSHIPRPILSVHLQYTFGSSQSDSLSKIEALGNSPILVPKAIQSITGYSWLPPHGFWSFDIFQNKAGVETLCSRPCLPKTMFLCS